MPDKEKNIFAVQKKRNPMHRLYVPLVIILSFFHLQRMEAQTFSPPRILHQHATNLVVGKIVLADLNGDTRQDILVSGSDPNVAWFRQQTNGTFTSIIPIYDEEIFGEAVDATDIDGDGDVDIVAATSFGTGIVWIENLGEGEFGPFEHITSIEYPIDDMILVDLNHDGQKDILVSSYSAVDKLGAVHWLQNLGGGSFGFPNTVTESAREVKKLETADMNNDGLTDIVLASYWDFRLAWYENYGGGSFSSARFVRPVEDSIYNHGVVALDVDLDGDIDLVNTRTSKPLITWLENDGLGNFIEEYTILHDDGGWDIATGDFNLDGYPDLVTGLSAADQTVIFYNSGTRSFSAPHVIGSGQSVPNDVFVADLDYDQDREVFIATTLDRRFMYFENFRIDCSPIVSAQENVICAHDTLQLGPLTVYHPGTYIYASENDGQCDSVHIIHLVESPAYVIQISDTLHEGVPFTLPDGQIVSQAGEYIIALLTEAGCDSTIIVQLFPDPFTSENSPSIYKKVVVSPNPTGDRMIIQTNMTTVGTLWYMVDAVGRPCLSGQIESESQHVDLKRLTPGVYTLILTQEGKLLPHSARVVRIEP